MRSLECDPTAKPRPQRFQGSNQVVTAATYGSAVSVRAVRAGVVVLLGLTVLPVLAGAAPGEPPSRIVFSRTLGDHQELFSVRPNGSGLRRLTKGGGHESQPRFSPDGRGWIVFARQRGPFRGSDLYAVQPGGARLHKMCRAENAQRPVPSPDGRAIAFLDARHTGGENRWHVRVVSLAGGRCRDVGTASEEWTARRAPPKTLARGSFADWG